MLGKLSPSSSATGRNFRSTSSSRPCAFVWKFVAMISVTRSPPRLTTSPMFGQYGTAGAGEV
ncbi:hypothetical protein ACFQV2_13575 [Actinokineospora soli]|uniref:Uncharacterized protein n=1 Tax=Actinokineospora soli TaxID=1048753 RepID=A0ABW2TLV7_9PSEU